MGKERSTVQHIAYMSRATIECPTRGAPPEFVITGPPLSVPRPYYPCAPALIRSAQPPPLPTAPHTRPPTVPLLTATEGVLAWARENLLGADQVACWIGSVCAAGQVGGERGGP
jgi:hypothetical protein